MELKNREWVNKNVVRVEDANIVRRIYMHEDGDIEDDKIVNTDYSHEHYLCLICDRRLKEEELLDHAEEHKGKIL